MNLFCFSLEGSMDSLYEPIPEQLSDQENTCGRTDSSVSTTQEENGQAHSKYFMEPSSFENAKPKRTRPFRRCASENKIFEGKTVNDTTWQKPSKPENDSDIKRPCQLKDINEVMNNNIHTLQGNPIHGVSNQSLTSECWNPSHHQRHIPSPEDAVIIKSGGDPVESMGTLKRLQKLVWTKKPKIQSLDEMKPSLLSLQDEDDALVSCMRLAKSQEKRMNRREKKETEITQNSFCSSLNRSHTSTGYNLEEMWNSWEHVPENPQWTCVDFQISQVGPWGDCSYCTHHPHLTSSFTDVDLLHSWRSSSFGNFDRFRNISVSKPIDSTEKHEGEPINENGEQHKASTNGGGLSKKMRNISWTMKKKVGKKYIKALSEEKDEEEGDDILPYRNSDPMIGTHTEKISLKASDSLDSLYSGQSSSSGITTCSDGTSNRDSFRLDDDSPYSGPFCGRARVHTDFTPSPYDTDSLKIKKGDIIDIICKTPMGMWTGMLNNKVGNFKFIYVDVISEEEEAPKKIKAHRRSKVGKPETLLEFLERIHLQEYSSTLLLNGYETLEDLKYIKESHLIELNIENSEDRKRFLSAAENLLEEENIPPSPWVLTNSVEVKISVRPKSWPQWGSLKSERPPYLATSQRTYEKKAGKPRQAVPSGKAIQEQENTPVPTSLGSDISLSKSQLDDCPRDSGCYISSGNSDNGKEELESENLPEMVQKISIKEPTI